MKKMTFVLLICFAVQVTAFNTIGEKETIEFESIDGLLITADLYLVADAKGMLLLCHQAGYSRGEYINTAKRLNALGYSCMAIDQRSGNGVNGIVNETANRAKEKGLPTNYINARQDIEAAIDFLYNKNNKSPIIIIGSSYSASLVLVIGKENNKVQGVAAFSPGEYLKGIYVAESIEGCKKQLYVTSSNAEIPKVKELVAGVDQVYLTHYKPKEKGIHGSRALWESTSGTDGYWESFLHFIKGIKP